MLTTEWIKEHRPALNGRTVSETASRVKMFVHNDPREAEAAVAEWLAQHPVLIDHVTQSQSERSGRFVFVVTVFYRQVIGD